MPDAWPIGPLPASLAVVDGDAPGGALSVLVTFDDKAIVDTWLRVTLKANANTGLAADQDFFFGNAIGETGAAFTGQGQFFGRDGADFNAIIAGGLNRPASVGDPQDINGDARVNIFDIQAIATAGIRPNVILAIMPQTGPPPAALASAAVAPAGLLSLHDDSSAAIFAKDRFFAAAGREWQATALPARFVPLERITRARSLAGAIVAELRDLTPAEREWATSVRGLALEHLSGLGHSHTTGAKS
jgi:hypothetical protein